MAATTGSRPARVTALHPRWLLRSLTVHYRELLDASSKAGASDDTWGSTPMQYLEKIFQIPFTLPPVDRTGYTTLVDALTAPTSIAGRQTPNWRHRPSIICRQAAPRCSPTRSRTDTQPAVARCTDSGTLRPARPHR